MSPIGIVELVGMLGLAPVFPLVMLTPGPLRVRPQISCLKWVDSQLNKLLHAFSNFTILVVLIMEIVGG